MRIHLSPAPVSQSLRVVDAKSLDSTTSMKENQVFSTNSALPSALAFPKLEEADLEQRLFENRANVKVLTSQISMHLGRAVRDDLFHQIDDLLDPAAWDDECALVSQLSFQTFLRFVTAQPKLRRAALSVSLDGNIMASWFGNDRRMTIEFLSSDKVRLVTHRKTEEKGGESLAYEGDFRRLEKVLGPIQAEGLYLATA